MSEAIGGRHADVRDEAAQVEVGAILAKKTN